MEKKNNFENKSECFQKSTDLNCFVVHITRLYSHIFDQLKARYPRCRLNSWIDAFVVSSELESQGDTSLKQAIAKVMETEAGITIDEWKQLQEIRRIRNAVCHPNSSVSRAREALRERWQDHPAKVAIEKMLAVSARVSTPPRTPSREVPTSGWRDRPRDKKMCKFGLKKRFASR